jgi:hypothetical protein
VVPSVFLAIPNMGWLHTGLARNVRHWDRAGIIVHDPSGIRPIPRARNACVLAFMESDATHLWFVDADTVPSADAPDILLGAGRVAVSGVVHQMKVDDDGVQKPVGMVMRRNGNGNLKAAYQTGADPVEPIDACGSGCVMYERGVFETLPFPWYEERPWGPVPGSDLILGEKMAAAGIPLHAHFGVVCVHRKEVDF